MVAVKTTNYTRVNTFPTDTEIDPFSLRYAPNHRIRTDKAAQEAICIASDVERGTIADDDPGEGPLFRAFHTCAYRAACRRRRESITLAERMEWTERWRLIRDYLIERNLGLVYTMISDFRSHDLDTDEQRSEAMLALVRAVEGFNPWRGFRFSTYACNAIVRALIHHSRKTRKHRSRFPVGHEAWLERSTPVDTVDDLHADRVRQALDRNLGELTDREALVIGWRFPLHGGLSRTLGEVGAAIGLSKERVRQIQERALSKLRGVLEADPVMQ
jgi:RNA polymerase sigma factor (sigma-70 family)